MDEAKRGSRLPKLLKARDVADATGISAKTIYTYVQRGLIPYVKIQSNVRFYEDEIREWIEAHAYRIARKGGRR